MRYVPSQGRVILFQAKEKKSESGLLFIPNEAVEAKQFAEIVAVSPEDDQQLLNTKVFFDIGFTTTISDTDEGRYSVIDIENILCWVYDE